MDLVASLPSSTTSYVTTSAGQCLVEALHRFHVKPTSERSTPTTDAVSPLPSVDRRFQFTRRSRFSRGITSHAISG